MYIVLLGKVPRPDVPLLFSLCTLDLVPGREVVVPATAAGASGARAVAVPHASAQDRHQERAGAKLLSSHGLFIPVGYHTCGSPCWQACVHVVGVGDAFFSVGSHVVYFLPVDSHVFKPSGDYLILLTAMCSCLWVL